MLLLSCRAQRIVAARVVIMCVMWWCWWSGGCGSRSAAKSSGAQNVTVILICLSLLWLCNFWNVHAFGNGVLSVDCVNGCYAVRLEELWLFSRLHSPDCVTGNGMPLDSSWLGGFPVSVG